MENALRTIKSVRTLLKITYGLVPIIAGADKFTNLLARWSDYLNPAVLSMLPVDAATFMLIVGVIEIIAGILVLINPRMGGYVVSAWLILIAVSLVAAGHFFDVAVRDLVMAVGAFSLAQISGIKNQS